MSADLLVVSYGGGTNSAAVLCGLAERGERPDAVVFADTGGERPSTYQHVALMSRWCEARGWPAITVVRYATAGGVVETLEENCLRSKRLPSIAYGIKACSEKWKRRPQERWAAGWQPALDSWNAGRPVIKCIGYDADETDRVERSRAVERGPQERARWEMRYPLVEWDWGRPECVAAIARAGLPQPGKSSCFFCPSMKKAEIRAQAREYPALSERALAMEANAESTSVVGLGRRFAWGDLLRGDAAQCRLWPEPDDAPCGCAE